MGNAEYMGSMLTDIRRVCPLQEMARSVASDFQGGAKVYSYVATHGRTEPLIADSTSIADSTTDVEAIFGVYPTAAEADAKFAANMQDLFYTYVRRGVLTQGNKDALAAVYVVGTTITTQAHYQNCDFWKSASNIVPDYADFN